MTPTPQEAGPTIILATHESREVSWSHTHAELWPIVERALRYGPLPLIGTHGWLALDPADPARVGAVYLAADQFALHLENDQTARSDAATEAASALSWSTASRRHQQLTEFRRTNPWAQRRVVA
ncbi:DUF2742 domain-containing protein [Gordonia polyisoprenivorans]|uniref:DUF2742 domain-containing protein n=1 Tax=Gordonia polyisoprenivorans TaxID=84595 RepID=UPI001B8B0D60|nr:DUF2742 domain-containing protein [Gordonia polyisoprenivorans]QUD82100.1 DUF2742 domain-containing protein [Gordonia polyisoprenivorans]